MQKTKLWMDILHKYDNLKNGEKEAYREEIMEMYNISKDKFYRLMKENNLIINGYQPNRKTRRDKGVSKISRDTVESILEIQIKLSQGGKNIVAAEFALDEAFRLGYIKEPIPVTTYRRLLKQYGLNNITKRCSRFEAVDCNIMHQFDWTGSKNMVMDKNNLVEIAQAWQKGKRHEAVLSGKRLWLIGIVDDHSRYCYAEYVYSAGEDVEKSLNFLGRAWKSMGSIPYKIYLDNGSTHKDSEFLVRMAALDIKVPGTMPGNSKSRGKVEAKMKFLNHLDLIIANKIRDIDSVTVANINEMLFEEIAKYNKRRHPRYRKQAKDAIYKASKTTRPITFDNLIRILDKLGERKVSPYGTIIYKAPWADISNEYKIIIPKEMKRNFSLIGQKVILLKSLNGEFYIRDKDSNKFMLEVFAPNAVTKDEQEFNKAPATEFEKSQKEMKENPINFKTEFKSNEPEEDNFDIISESFKNKKESDNDDDDDIILDTLTSENSSKKSHYLDRIGEDVWN